MAMFALHKGPLSLLTMNHRLDKARVPPFAARMQILVTSIVKRKIERQIMRPYLTDGSPCCTSHYGL
jgi:hypothetical protein